MFNTMLFESADGATRRMEEDYLRRGYKKNWVEDGECTSDYRKYGFTGEFGNKEEVEDWFEEEAAIRLDWVTRELVRTLP